MTLADTARIGALDVGTNTVLMLVAEACAPRGLRKIADFSRITRLGRGVDQTRRLDPGAAKLTADTIVEFAQKARALGAGPIVAAATAALRDAADGREFIAALQARSGVALEIISGETEAALSHLAVTRGLSLDPKKTLLIVDIGGGSTEFIAAEPGRALRMKSLKIGSVRLTERIVRHDPPAHSEAEQLREAIDREIAALDWDFRPGEMVGIAGTVTTICAAMLGLKAYDPDRVHGHRLSRAEVKKALSVFASATLAERRAIPSMLEGRADVIFAGTMILDRAMAWFGADSIVVSDQGVRWGLAWRERDRLFGG